MKTFRTPFLPFLLVFFSFCVNAQEKSTSNNAKLERLESLSQEQKILLKERREIIKSLSADFKASLTDAQSSILKNDSMNKKQRRKEFVESLTDAQRVLYRAMREGVRQSRGAYHKSLSKDHKDKIKKRHKHKKKHGHRGVEKPFAPAPPAPPEQPEPIKNGDQEIR